MLSSDFEICMIYAKASIKASIVNVRVNLENIDDQEYKKEIEEKIDDLDNQDIRFEEVLAS